MKSEDWIMLIFSVALLAIAGSIFASVISNKTEPRTDYCERNCSVVHDSPIFYAADPMLGTNAYVALRTHIDCTPSANEWKTNLWLVTNDSRN